MRLLPPHHTTHTTHTTHTHTTSPCRRCVSIVAASALRAMIKPGVLAVAAPCCVGIAFRLLGAATGQSLLGARAVAGMLMFTTVTGKLKGVVIARV